ncbi:hypothetical protein [Mangrovicoccus algicola]|uniref:Transmembrane protein n=1 Tax=Mangrovicoccus algicola TaxID=2771008 RepID=A0A8J6Z5U8_9RHOB|nr:hypothetical protein [Mangrovicoccus algicola]MBE3638304.1 hypothetical protein [Mangrovicoccus algicola]
MRGLFHLMLGLAAYLGLLILSQTLLGRPGFGGGPLGLALTLSPMLPALFICAVIIRTIRQLDEMQRKLQFEALAVAFAGTALITFGYGFLEGAGFPRLSMFTVWPLMAGIWCAGVLVGLLRFR